jgi:hypothetical protein
MRHLTRMSSPDARPGEFRSDEVGGRPPNVVETFDRLVNTVTHAIDVARRAGACANEAREATALAALDVIDLGELLGMLDIAAAERRRAEIRTAIDDLERS